jgi:DNA-binding NarL/FixJ family response regulator
VAQDQPLVKVLLADDQSLFREAVRVVLETQADIRVVAETRDPLQAVHDAERTRPDVALIAVVAQNCAGIRASRLISERLPECRVIAVAPQEDQTTLTEALEAGASGYISKESPLSHLIYAVRAAHRGETLIPPKMLGPLLGQLIRRRREQQQALHRVSRLTPREREVLALLSEGGDNDTIAAALVISPETARTHVQNVLGKLGVHSRLEAAAFVMQNDILSSLVGSEP